jgi:nucleoside-diphosphate-sugar epimerase
MPMTGTLLVGATGMIGQAVIANAGERQLTILARRELDDLPEEHALLVAPPERWADIIAVERPAVLISCLGTTIRQAGSQAAFRAVDHDLILSAAKGARMAGTRQMILVSAVGASANSRNFYLKTKGETEDGLRALGFERLDILRPGLLMGDRAGPKRLGEGIAMVAAPITDALLHGSLRRYRSIPGDIVARAIVALAGMTQPGVRIHENDAMRRLAD